MNFEKLWNENRKTGLTPYALGIEKFAEEWFNKGAEEKEKEMLEFAEWYCGIITERVLKKQIGDGFGGANKAFEFWKKEVEGK